MDYLNNMISNVKLFLETRNISARQFAMSIGVAPSTFIDSLKSKKGFSVETALKIADAFGYSLEELAKCPFTELLSRELPINNFTLSENELHIIDTYRSFNEEGKLKVITYVDDLNRAGIYKNDYQFGMVHQK